LIAVELSHLVIDNRGVVNVDVIDVGDVVDDDLLLNKSPRRSGIHMGKAELIVCPQSCIPAGIATPEIPGMIAIDRAIAAANVGEIEPGSKAEVDISGIVIVAEVVMAEAWPAPQVCRHHIDVDADRGAVKPTLPDIDCIIVKRSEQTASPTQRVVPITIYEHVAARGPDVAGRYPNPSWPADNPVAWLPQITRFTVNPGSGHPDMVIGRLRRLRTVFQGRRRFGEIDRFFLLLVGPVARHPLPLVVDLIPITGDPLPAGRHHPPETGDPQKFVFVVIPMPVTGDPGNVVAIWFLIRWDLFDVGRRLAGNERTRLRVKIDRLGKSLVDGPTG
jgi:hypothetical protein